MCVSHDCLKDLPSLSTCTHTLSLSLSLSLSSYNHKHTHVPFPSPPFPKHTLHPLHEQDEELQTQGEVIERLTSQLHELEDNLGASQKEGILLKKQITVIEQELLNSQDEVHEVMQALEELAVSYDCKDREIEAAQNEKKLFVEELEKLQVTGACLV